MPVNVLYLAVLPLVQIKDSPFQARAQEMLTLFPDREFASSFYPNEVETYLTAFKVASKDLIGGHVTGYDFVKEPTEDGRIIVKVVQHVG